MFGIGPQELLILSIVGFLCIGMPIAIIVVIVVLLGKRNPDSEATPYSQLLEENQRLRDELAAEKSKNT